MSKKKRIQKTKTEPVFLKDNVIVQKYIDPDGDFGAIGVVWEDVNLADWENEAGEDESLNEFLVRMSRPGDVFRVYILDIEDPKGHVSVHTHRLPITGHMEKRRTLYPCEFESQ